MYLKRVVIENIKCFGRAELNLVRDDGQVKRWSVILGENGTGKSTLLQAIVMVLMGPDLQSPGPARRLGPFRSNQGATVCEAIAGQNDQLTERGRPRREPYTASYAVTGDAEVSISGVLYDRLYAGLRGHAVFLTNALKRGLLSEKLAGWFAAG